MKKVIASQASLGTISIQKSIKSIIYDIVNKFSLELNENDLDTLITYLAYFNYYTFKQELFSYQDQLIVIVYSTDDQTGYIKFDQTNHTIVFIEDCIITDFTSKERTDVIYTPLGKCIVYSFNDFNTAIYFNPNSSKKIRILSDRSLSIPKNLEPDDIKDFSNNPEDFYKILEEYNYSRIIKLNLEFKPDILT